MSVTEFTGHVTMMRADAEFYGAEDFIGRGDVPMKIDKILHCENRKVAGKTKPVCFTIRFVNGEKELVLNATNRQMLTHLYGPNAKDWKGKWVWCFVEPCRSTTGGTTLGVRFRDRKDEPKQEAQHPAKTTADTGVTDQQVSELRARLAKHIPNDDERRRYVVETLGVTNPTKASSWSREQYSAATIFCDEMEGPV